MKKHILEGIANIIENEQVSFAEWIFDEGFIKKERIDGDLYFWMYQDDEENVFSTYDLIKLYNLKHP
jgi:hypothetical protein